MLDESKLQQNIYVIYAIDVVCVYKLTRCHDETLEIYDIYTGTEQLNEVMDGSSTSRF